ncbi:MAG TPA: acyl-CoA thioesterase domain-containing protein [Polyangiales bacterium]
MAEPTHPAVEELLELLDLRKIGEGLFSGAPARDLHGNARVFGGQLLAQALAAASFSVQRDWQCHSLHAYFVRPSTPGRPIEYEVLAMRDGQSFVLRKVAAVQRDELCFELTASFELPHEGPEHQEPMPDAPAPESFPSEGERIATVLETVPAEFQEWVKLKRAVEMIRMDSRTWNSPAPQHKPLRTWVRARSRLVDDPQLHRCVLAYASDFIALEPSMDAVAARYGDPESQVASLDHSIWFHRPFRVDEWLLFVFDSHSVAGGRGLNRGRVYARTGELVASIAQENLMRRR